MPFAGLDRPALGLSLLKAQLARADVATDVAYLNIRFATAIGVDEYVLIMDGFPVLAMAGEWVFAEAAWGEALAPGRSYLDSVLHAHWRVGGEHVDSVRRARAAADPFLEAVLDDVPWDEYDVVGFASSGAQNLAAIALARRVKERHACIPIVFGGHNWHGEMGRALFRETPWVDYAFTGHADHWLPGLVRALAGEDGTEIRLIPGLCTRENEGEPQVAADAANGDLDSLETPDHSDYFAWLRSCGLDGKLLPVVPLETSRGCWWASRSPCSFCALNGEERSYRTMSPGHVIDVIATLARRWPGTVIELVDNVVSRGFLTTVLPAICAQPDLPRMTFKVRPEITLGDLRNVARAGASILCGVESLDDHLLGMMGKGVGSLENIRFLRWCRELDIPVEWNMLCGVPGERQEDYATQTSLLTSVDWLSPPADMASVLLERSSVFFENAERWGFRDPRPAEAYSHIYPFSHSRLAEVAYFFEHDYCPGASVALQMTRLRRGLRRWRADQDRGRLTIDVPADGPARISDSRRAAGRPRRVLERGEALVLQACEDIRTRDQVRDFVCGRSPDMTAGEIDVILEGLLAERVIAAAGGRYLSLAGSDVAR